MKYLILINIVIGLWTQFSKIATTNEIKSEAEIAYRSKDYQKAVTLYQSLMVTYQLEDENISLNLANALYLINERKKAIAHYQILTNSNNPQIRSVAFQQLGLITAFRGKYEPALLNFKKALETDPNNEKARYNYELIKKIHDQELSELQESKLRKKENGEEKQKTNSGTGSQKERESLIKKSNSSGAQHTSKGEKQKDGNLFDTEEAGDRERKSQKSDPNSHEKEKELESDKKGNKDMEALRSKRLNEIKISEEKALMILDLMKNEEVQYIQERRRLYSNQDYKNKPDW